MICFIAITPNGRRILVFGVEDRDIDGMRDPDLKERRILSAETPGRIDECVVIYGSESYIVGRLQKLGMTVGQVQRKPTERSTGGVLN